MPPTGRPSDELKRRREEEYEMQLFGLHSRTVLAAINQKINESVDSQCQKIDASIKKKYNPNAEGLEILKSNIKLLKKTYRNNMRPHLVTIENVVNKFICIPSNVLLEEDKCQMTQYSDEEFHNLEKKLENLQEEAKRVTIFNAALKEELETLEQLKESKDLATHLCGIIHKGLSTKRISSKTLHAIEKSKSLTDALNTYQPKTPKDIFNPKIDDSDIEQIFLNS